jgi:O-antigen ligase/tetratricopeptide (TPR) repeat protein
MLVEQKSTALSNVSKNNKTILTIAIEATIISLIILVPVAFYPYCITVFIPAKKMVAEVLVIIGLLFWGFKIVTIEKIKFVTTPVNLPVLSFIIICALSLVWSDNRFLSLRELPLFLTGPLLYFIIINNISGQQQVNRIVNILLIVGALFGIYGIFQYMGIDFSIWDSATGRQQVFGIFGNVNFFAEYLIVILPIAISLFFVKQNKTRKILLLIAVLSMSASLIFTFTRGSYLGFGISLIFMFVLFIIYWPENFKKNKKKIFIVILTAIAVVTFVFLFPNPLNKPGTAIDKIKNRVSVSQLTQGYSIKRRMATWKFTILMIKDRPLLGSGIGTYKYNTLRYQADFFSQGDNRSLYPHGFADKAHNEYLQLWVELGIIGFGIFLWLIFIYFSYGLKALRNTKDKYKQGMMIGLMGAVVAVLVDAIFGFPLHLPATVILFWLALGLTIVLGLADDKYNKTRNSITHEDNKIAKIEKTENAKETETDNKNKQSRLRKILWFKILLSVCIVLIATFLVITTIRPFIARTYWYQAEKKSDKGDMNKTIDTYYEALKWDPYLGEVYYEIGKILMRNGFSTPALEYFKKAEKYVDLPALPLELARAYINKDMWDEGAVKLKQAISYQSRESSMFPLYAELGDIYLKLEKHKQAELAFQNSLKIKADFVNSHYGLARAYLNQSLFDKALIEFQKVIELAPDSLEAGYAKQVIQQLLKDKAVNE